MDEESNQAVKGLTHPKNVTVLEIQQLIKTYTLGPAPSLTYRILRFFLGTLPLILSLNLKIFWNHYLTGGKPEAIADLRPWPDDAVWGVLYVAAVTLVFDLIMGRVVLGTWRGVSFHFDD